MLQGIGNLMGISDIHELFYGSANIQCEFKNIHSRPDAIDPKKTITVGDLRITVFLNIREEIGRSRILNELNSLEIEGAEIYDNTTTLRENGTELQDNFGVTKTFRGRFTVFKARIKFWITFSTKFKISISSSQLSVTNSFTPTSELKKESKRSDLLKWAGKKGRIKKAIQDAQKAVIAMSRTTSKSISVHELFGVDEHGKPVFDRLKWSGKSRFLKKTVQTIFDDGKTYNSEHHVLALVITSNTPLFDLDLNTASLELQQALDQIEPKIETELSAPIQLADFTVTKRRSGTGGGVIGGGNPPLY